MTPEKLYRWVKASERLPDEEVFVATKSSPSELIDERFRLNDKWVSRVSVYHNEQITEWLEPIENSEQDELWDDIENIFDKHTAPTGGGYEADYTYKYGFISDSKEKYYLIKK